MFEPTPKPAPAKHGTSQGAAIGQIHGDATLIFVHERVLDQILDYSERNLRRELGGFLVGVLHMDQRCYVEIRHFLPAIDTRSRAASLTFTHDTWSMLHREVEQNFPDELLLGWHHTHPGFGIFLSGYDLFIHRNFFRQPWQVAMVVDPKRHEFGFFQWVGDAVVDCGFVCVWDKEGE